MADCLALIADLAGARRQRDKDALGDRLRQVLAETMGKHGKELATRLEPTAWDEWEGVLRRWAVVPALIRLWRERLFPLGFHVGLGWGPLESRLDEDPRRVTGPAFYRAREALAEAQRRNTILHIEGRSGVEDILMVSGLQHALGRRWTARQREVAAAYERAGSVQRAGRLLGVTHQNVSQVLRQAEYGAYRQAEDYLARRFASLDEGGPA